MGHYFNSMQALRALLIFALLTLAGSSHEKPSDLRFLIRSPSCKTAEECYEKEIMTGDNKPLQVPRKACTVHKACKCIPLAVPTCRPMHSDRTGCPTSLQCHSRDKDNCEKDSDCQELIKSCTEKDPCICVSKLPSPKCIGCFHQWFKVAGVCIRKSDGCKPGQQPKTCKDPDYPKNPKPCNHPKNSKAWHEKCVNVCG